MDSTSSDKSLAVYFSEEAAPSRTLIDILEASTKASPDALAIDNGTSRLTYTQLADEITKHVEKLRQAGVGAGDRVGVRVSSGSLELYVSILSVLAAGAAYVPVDVDEPEERAELVWSEASVSVVIGDQYTLTKLKDSPSTSDTDTLSHRKPTPQDDAWIIFTSGSTGKPKGVAVSHRSAAAFVDAESAVFLTDKPLASGDRVLAALSVAFDASCEEMWLAWRHSACLVPAPRALVKAGADLGSFLTAQRITVVSTVPTLAALWPADAIRNLRLLILGGEACSAELATRLTSAVDTVINTYGPTEATVVASFSRLVASQVVRIGLPLPGWKLAVVGPDEKPVPWGESGELVIGGVGVARYLDAEKDKLKFAPATCFNGERAYRSGDLVRADKEGLVFVGRDDEQIKLNGRRIELGEIDAALLTLPGVTGAASAIRRSEIGNQVLVGYIVRNRVVDDEKISLTTDRELLSHLLPSTLLPMLVTVDDIPIRTSGKVDRKALPWPPPTQQANVLESMDGTMAWLAKEWQRVLGIVPTEPDANFFALGGASLAAAQLVSQLRERCPMMSIADIYACATLETMAARVDELSSTQKNERLVKPTARWVMFVQMSILSLELIFAGLRNVTLVTFSKKIIATQLPADSWAARHDVPWWLLAILWVLFITFPGRLLLCAGFVRIITVGIKPGVYIRGGPTHLRVWGAERFIRIVNIDSIAGTPWVRLYARLLGCHVGKDVQLHTLPPTTGLATFDSGCAIEPEVDLAGWWIDGDCLHVGSTVVGEGARIGTRTVVMPNTVIKPYATVASGISVQGVVRSPEFPTARVGTSTRREGGANFWTYFRYTMTLLLLDLLPVLQLAPAYALPAAILADYGDFRRLMLSILIMAVPSAVAGFVLYVACVVGLVRFASNFIRPGVFQWNRSTAWAAWLTHYLMLASRPILFPLYASLFTPNWFRLLGAKIGHSVEISTIVPFPSLLSVKNAAFLADDVLLSSYELEDGSVRLGSVSVGEKSFVGNSAIVEIETDIPDQSLVSVLATAPRDMQAGSMWLGRPALSIPRKADTNVADAFTFQPPTRLVLARAFVEIFRAIPVLISGVLATSSFVALYYCITTWGVGISIPASAALFLSSGLVACVVTTAAKWILTPKIHADMKRPLWSSFVWRNELADTFVQSLALPLFIDLFTGTPFLSWWMTTLGAKIGPGVWLESHLLPEAELCEIEAGATVNRGCVLQTHLFHDRVMRLNKVRLQRGATLGPKAIMLPGATVAANATIAPNSLVMLGEHVPSGTRWMGNPTGPWVEEKRESMGKIDSAESSE